MDTWVSIIIPVYNSEKTIRFCLDHILNINKKCYEVLIVNDGGTDATIKIVNTEYSQFSCIKIYDLPHNGVSYTRNFGIEKSSGEWIIFVDSDQTLSNNLLDNIEAFADEDIVMFNRATLWLKENSSHIMSPEKLEAKSFNDNNQSLSFLYNQLPSTGKQNFWCTDKMFRASIIKGNNIRFPNEIDLGEDGIFVTHFMKHVNKMRVLPNVYNLALVKKGLELQHLATKKRSIDVIYRVVSEVYNTVNDLALSNNSEAAKSYAENYIQDRLIRAFVWNSDNYDLDNEAFEEFVHKKIIPIYESHDPNYIKKKDIRFFRDCLLSRGLNYTLRLSFIYNKYRSIKGKIIYVTRNLYKLI